MSVYIKENPDYLRESISSMLNQSIVTNDFVLVCDGTLTAELWTVIEYFQERNPDLLNVIKLKKNKGLGNALRIGLTECKNELVARMDSDDISHNLRCQRQLEIFSRYPYISVVSGTVEEFDKKTGRILSRRKLPQWHDEILKYSKYRCPFNHPCVMYKKNDVLEVGSYLDLELMEDYYLWTRMLMAGKKGYNIPDILLKMRSGDELYKRRAGYKYFLTQEKLFKFMLNNGWIGMCEYFFALFPRLVSCMAPNLLRRKMYELFLRR